MFLIGVMDTWNTKTDFAVPSTNTDNHIKEFQFSQIMMLVSLMFCYKDRNDDEPWWEFVETVEYII